MHLFLRVGFAVFGAFLFSSCASREPGVCGSENSLLGPALVPDRVFGADFSQACVHHDACYGVLGGTRKSCDRKFRAEVLAAAKEAPLALRIPARLSAEIYAFGVRIGGKKAYLEGMVIARAEKKAGKKAAKKRE
ncbi:MAG: hypothetical protein ACI8UO_006290 [Verrucomicrobiales bacterium]|jgi:hypothetical protein